MLGPSLLLARDLGDGAKPKTFEGKACLLDRLLPGHLSLFSPGCLHQNNPTDNPSLSFIDHSYGFFLTPNREVAEREGRRRRGGRNQSFRQKAKANQVNSTEAPKAQPHFGRVDWIGWEVIGIKGTKWMCGGAGPCCIVTAPRPGFLPFLCTESTLHAPLGSTA